MTDTDQRLAAVAEIIADLNDRAGYPTVHDRAEAHMQILIHDALRAFDQATDADPRCPNCRGITDHLAWCPYGPSQPESEVMPHSTGHAFKASEVDNATAPVMGADPPHLDESDLFRLRMAKDHDFAMRGKSIDAAQSDRRFLLGMLDKIAFANAQPPSGEAVEEAYRAYRESESDDVREVMRAALIAAAKARSGA